MRTPLENEWKAEKYPSWIRSFFSAVFAILSSLSCLNAGTGGVGSGAVSLPSGPGSLEGLGDSFQASLNTGTGSHHVAIAAAVGTGGLAPRIQLNYDGGSGNGPLGLGWSFGAGSIQRRTDKGIPRYIDGPNGVDDDFDGIVDNSGELDVFLDPTGEELVPIANETVTNYFCRVEGSFIRYRRMGDHWEGDSPVGSKLIFGLTPSARIADARDESRVFQWLLEREVDPHGNTIEYHYSSFPGEANLNEKYLSEIRYGSGSGSWENFHFLAFAYEDRSDWSEDCRSGFIRRIGKRLVRIDSGTQGPLIAGHAQGDFNHDGKVDNLNRRYVLTYTTNSFRSLLASVTLLGCDGTTAYPSSRYRYTVENGNKSISASGKVITSANEPAVTFENGFVDLVDLNGDGLPDLLHTLPGGSGHFGYINYGSRGAGPGAIVWGAALPVNAGEDGLAWNADLGAPDTHLVDVDGDGLPDLVKVGLDGVDYFLNQPRNKAAQVGWGNRARLAAQDFPAPTPFTDRDARSADINFDKRIDTIKSINVGNGIAYQIWYNIKSNLNSPRITVTPAKGYSFSSDGVQIVDFNGDRVPDVTSIRPTGILVTAGLGYGQFADEVEVRLPAGEFLNDDQLLRSTLQDINGDGLVDLVVYRSEPGKLWFWLNRGNYSLESKREITDLPLNSGISQIRWADMNGNGTTDLVIADKGSIPHLAVVDIGLLMGGVPRPHLLTEINNGVGGVTRLEYRSSADYMIADGTDSLGNYRYSWPNVMPFPVEVVAREVLSDSLGNDIETLFNYHDAYYDPIEKQFRGFARAERTLVGDASSPSSVQRESFDVGDSDLAMKGRLLRSSMENINGGVFSEVKTEWRTYTFGEGKNGIACRWAAASRDILTVVELGLGTPKRMESEYKYDEFGNRIETLEHGLIENGDPLVGNDERYTSRVYAHDTNRWLIRFPIRDEVRDGNGKLITRLEHFYDDPEFTGQNFGQVSTGDETLVRQWYEVDRPDGFIRSRRARYDAYGNLAALLDPLGDGKSPDSGHWREFEFDSRFHQFPTREIQHVGGGHPDLVVMAEYDEGFGTSIRTIDANGHVTRRGFDVFGRQKWEIRPGDAEEFPSHEFRYGEAVSIGTDGLINFSEVRILDRHPAALLGGVRDSYYHISRIYIDGLGRTRLTKSEAESDPETGRPRYVGTGGSLLNAKGLIATSLSSYFSDTIDFDDIRSADWRGTFHLNGGLARLDLDRAPAIKRAYDAAGRLILRQFPDGSSDMQRFEPLVVNRFDENGTKTNSPHFGRHLRSTSDGLGRTVQVDEICKIDDEGHPSANLVVWSTQYRFRADDLLLSVSDSQGNEKSMEYDGLGRRTSLRDWDRGVIKQIYDDSSNCIERADAKGQIVKYSYDGANRLVSEDYLDDNSKEFSYGLKPDVVYTYDNLSLPVDFGDGQLSLCTNSLGRLVQVQDTFGSEFFSYDSRGRSSWKVKRIPESPGGALISFRTAYEYDEMDRTSKLIYPDNDFVIFEYNDGTSLQRIRGGPTGFIISERQYTPNGQEAFTRFGNGVEARYSYDNRLRLQRVTTGNSGSPGGLISYKYDFDSASNITDIWDERPLSVINDGSLRRNSQHFEYDDLYRLIDYRVSHNGPGSERRDDGRVSYRYDRIGNLLEQKSTLQHEEQGWSVTDLGTLSYGGTLGRFGRVPGVSPEPGPHAATKVVREGLNRAIKYDANGNVVAIGASNQLRWDINNRLVSYSDQSEQSEYRYDYAGRRVWRRTGGVISELRQRETTLYVSRAFEIRPHGEVVKYVFDGMRRIAQISGWLNSTNRLQRMRLKTGWNLQALTVDVPNLKNAFKRFESLGIDAIRLWNPGNQSVLDLTPESDGPAGSVLWIHSGSATTLGLLGTEANAPPGVLPLGGGFWPAVGPTPLDVRSVLPAPTPFWRFIPETQQWVVYDVVATGPGKGPGRVSSGEVFYTAGPVAALSGTNVPASRIRFYHEDHLGSQTVVTDEVGGLVEESAYYPFGERRNLYRRGGDTVPYAFGGKEREEASGLYYYETRYLHAGMARFVSADPVDRGISPQDLNRYSFVGNRPTMFGDPTGLTKELIKRKFNAHNEDISDKGKHSQDRGYGDEYYVSSSIWDRVQSMTKNAKGNLMRTVVKFNDRELAEREVIINQRGLLIYKQSGAEVDTKGFRSIQSGGSDGVMMFVQTAKGNMYVASSALRKIHHSSFTGGAPVAMAGEIKVTNGKIKSVENRSGHYRPGVGALDEFRKVLTLQGADLNRTKFKRLGNNGVHVSIERGGYEPASTGSFASEGYFNFDQDAESVEGDSGGSGDGYYPTDEGGGGSGEYIPSYIPEK